MNKLFFIFFVIVAVVLFSCIYDPPLRGKNVFIENQTDDYIFVADSLKGYGFLKFYDTLRINGNEYISAEPNYISPFTKWQNFISEMEFKTMKNNNITQMIFYFIKGENVLRPIEKIRTNKLYDSITINLVELEQNDLNYIFYYKDSVTLNHEFSMSWKKL